MAKIVNLMTIAGLGFSMATGSAVEAPNLEYLQAGYNIYLGNPIPTQGGRDPGFGKNNIFAFTYATSNPVPGSAYLEPEHVNVKKDTGCKIVSSVTTMDSMTSYENQLKVQAKIDGTFPFGSFSASTDYKNMDKTFSSGQQEAAVTTGTCNVYEASLNTLRLPPLDSEFVGIALGLPDEYDSTCYLNFIKNYGTHFIDDIIMGARISMVSTYSKSTAQDLQSKNISISAAVKASYIVKIGVSGSYADDTQSASKSIQESFNSELSTIGSLPPKDGDTTEWAHSITEPMPVEYSLTDIAELFVPANFPKDTDRNHLANIKVNIIRALSEDYCPYLLNQGKLASCSPSNHAKQGSCRLCAGGCGSQWTKDNGIFDVPSQNSNYFMDYPDHCNGGSLSSNTEFGAGVHLCCMPEVPGVLEGSLKMCTACGGEYSTQVGHIQVHQASWYGLYPDNCVGNIQTIGKDDTSAYLCTNKDTCSLCVTCGGAFPYQTGGFTSGILTNTQIVEHYDTFKGRQCSDTITGEDSIAMVQSQVPLSICCASDPTITF